MAAPFEILLDVDRDRSRLQEIADAAFDLARDLDAQLSSYLPTSDICFINATAYDRPARIEPHLMRLLATARRLWRETDGAFDVTVGPLVHAWGFFRREGHVPDPPVLAAARERVGMQHVRLDEENLTVSFDRPGVEINLGAIGKGFVVDCVVEALRGWGIRAAVVHSAQSSIATIGRPLAGGDWYLGVADPFDLTRSVGVLPVNDGSLSISGSAEQSFQHNGRIYSHILDPRTGEPVQGQLAGTAVVGPTAAETDALATAFFVMGVDNARRYCEGRKAFAAVLFEGETADSMHTHTVGCSLEKEE